MTTPELAKRLRDEADLRRAETADDIASLLDEAADQLQIVGRQLYETEGRASALSRDLASARGCISDWVKFGADVTDALGLKVMSPKDIRAELERLRAQVAPAGYTRESALRALEHLELSNSSGRKAEAIAMLAAAPAQQAEPSCKRSHPHENMSPACEAATVEARAVNAAAQQAEPCVCDLAPDGWHGVTPRAFAARLRAASPHHPAQGIDDRSAFETWLRTGDEFEQRWLNRRDFPDCERFGDYCDNSIEWQWKAWQARAALAQAPAAEPLTDEDRTRALNLAYQFRSHPASRGIDEIEQAGETILSLLSEADALRRGEYICKRCGLRKDADSDGAAAF